MEGKKRKVGVVVGDGDTVERTGQQACWVETKVGWEEA